MDKARFFLYCCLFVVLLAFCVTGYWFYKTQSLKNNIVSTLGSFSLFEYSGYQLEGFFEYRSRVSFTKPILKIDNLNKPLLVRFDKLIFTSAPWKNEIKVNNPTATVVISAVDGQFHCKNIDEASISSMPAGQNGLAISIRKDNLECYLQNKNTESDTMLFDIAFRMSYSQKNSLESTIDLTLSLGEGTKKIETDITLVNLSERPPTYTLDVKKLDISTPEHRCNISGKMALSPGYVSIAKGKICLAVQGASYLLSSIEKSLDSGLTAQKVHGFLVKVRHFVDKSHDTLHICMQDKNEELVIGTEQNMIPLLKMF
ncbi:hypothetical protein [Neorickettsia sennetsu]|uniref:Uncharacterized protein n=1 Tax=Ehrlichia sennetsu (strain ATCC VR-367 / Miyayama) TaxID=222891 RepID=Q2GEB0_EHRS3|nr:hypothetical protein [Neorickettsia sennetsu]ABD45932.1 hypothetical protein NSE_0296 [Neorickettsia sennetsu str. Miyayama]